MELERAQRLHELHAEIEERQAELQSLSEQADIPELSEAELRARFHAIRDRLSLLSHRAEGEGAPKEGIGMPRVVSLGAKETPILQLGDIFLQFKAYDPLQVTDLYPPEIEAAWTYRRKIDENDSGPAYRAAIIKIEVLKLPHLFDENSTRRTKAAATLIELEKSLGVYEETVLQLSPQEAAQLGFSQEIVSLLRQNQASP
jgi:hypothetical protein